MKCAVHTEVDASGFCRNCGKAMCGTCTRDVRGIFYCEDCLAQVVAQPSATAPGAPNPALAFILGLIPGVGAVYNGQYMKALVHVLVFGSLIAIADAAGGPGEAIFGLLVAAFYIYMPIEAYQTAKARQLGQKPPSWVPEIETTQPIGAYLLIALGALLLLDNIIPGFNPWRWIGHAWPVILIVIGILLLRRRMQARPASGADQGPGGSTS